MGVFTVEDTGVVGNLGSRQDRRAIRAPQNPLDKSTVVSIYPREIKEKKPTTHPGVFLVPPGTYEEPSILVVGTSSWWKEIDPEQPYLEIPQSSVTVAESIVRDWANGLFQCDMGERIPGLFWVPGEKTLKEIRDRESVITLGPEKYITMGELLDRAKTKQNNWYESLVRASDILWARSNGNPLSISDDARLATQELELTKPWMADFTTRQLEKCPACGQLRDANFPVCQHCKTIVNPEQYKEMQLSAAS